MAIDATDIVELDKMCPAASEAGLGTLLNTVPHGATGAAYTQTYSTADRTISAPTADTLTDSSTGSAADQIIADITSAANVGSADVEPVSDAIAKLAEEVNALIVDNLDLRKGLTAVIDDLQAFGIAS